MVKAGVGGRASGVRNPPKTPVPDGKRPVATNRDISVGVGAGASVRHAPEEDKILRRDNLGYKRGRGLVRTRRRRHELAHHDGVRVLGEFGIHFFEAEFAVQVVGRLVVADAR